MRAKILLGGLSTVLFSASQATYGHPGHSSLPLPAESIAHYVFEPFHVLPALFAGLLIVVAIRWMACCRWRCAVQK